MKKHWLFTTLTALALGVICLGLFPTEAKAATLNDLTFTLNEDGRSYTITDCNMDASGSLTIPETYNGKPVTAIGDQAFFLTDLTGVTIPDSVTTIGDYAFSVSNLISITIPDSVTSIGSDAFQQCNLLTSVTIGSGVINIGDDAFNTCPNLTKITVSENNTSYSSDSCGVLFNKDKTEVILAPSMISGDYIIPDGVTAIGEQAFGYCNDLTGITIPNSVIIIGEYAFAGCDGLCSITIPDSVIVIGENAFATCEYLANVTIGSGVTNIGDGAFRHCSGLTGFSVSGNNPRYSADDYGVLFNKYKTELICAPGMLTGIYTVPNSVNSIGNWAFAGCYGMTGITIPESVTKIGDDAFANCGITNIIIPDGVTSIDESTFFWCTDLTDVTIPSSVTSIGYFAFEGCQNLTNVYYDGTKTAWEQIAIDYGNEDLIDANIHYVLATPAVKASNAVNGVKITWNAISGAKNYKVYKSVYSGGKWSSWTAIKTGVTGTTYTDTSVKSADNVKYTVRAFNGSSSSDFVASNSIKYIATPNVTVANAANGVKISWNKISGAKNYTVYKSVYSGGKWSGWTAIKTGVTGTTYTDTTVKSNDNVRYTAKAINSSFTSNIKASSSIKYLAAPTVTVSNASNGVKITWNAISGAKTYTVYKSVYTNGAWSGWKAIKTGVTGTSYTDTSVKSNANVKYTVRAFNGNFSSTYKSSSSIKFLATPTVKAANAAKGVTVTWNKIAGAKTYTVYRSVYSGGKWSGWTAIKTGVTGTSYTDTAVKSGATVRYTVKAINGNFRSNVKTGNTTKFLAQPTVKVAKATNGIKASWGKVTGATGYIVYRRTYSGGKWSGWTSIKTTTALSFTDTTAKKGVTYQYTVRVYSGSYKSSYTNSTSIKR